MSRIITDITVTLPRVGNWNFTIEHGLDANTVARASYMGSQGVALWSARENLNAVPLKYLSIGQYLTTPVNQVPANVLTSINFQLPWAAFPTTQRLGQALRPFPQYTGLEANSDNAGHSTYHAFVASLEHRFSKGLWLEASYTFSKLISNSDADNAFAGFYISNGFAANSIAAQNPWDRRADKALSEQDTPHRLVLAYTYELPIGKGRKVLGNANAVTEAVLGGWKISGVQTYRSGFPLSVGCGSCVTNPHFSRIN